MTLLGLARHPRRSSLNSRAEPPGSNAAKRPESRCPAAAAEAVKRSQRRTVRRNSQPQRYYLMSAGRSIVKSLASRHGRQWAVAGLPSSQMPWTSRRVQRRGQLQLTCRLPAVSIR